MDFLVLKSTIHFERYFSADVRPSLELEVVPDGSRYIDIGEKHVFAGARNLRGRMNDRHHVRGTIILSPLLQQIEDLRQRFKEDESPDGLCGIATFRPGIESDFHGEPPTLSMRLFIDADEFDRIVDMGFQPPNLATVSIDLGGIEYGWEPDSSHLIWVIDDENALSRDDRPITGFRYSIERGHTTEGELAKAIEKREALELADSPLSKDRELARLIERDTPDLVLRSLKEVRILLVLILGAVVILSMIVR